MVREAVTTPTWCKALPKVELHAHLSGSIPNDTVRTLLNRPANVAIRDEAAHLLDAETGRTLRQCFELFPVIHELIPDAATLRLVVADVLRSFADDNVVYLELRTTPRKTPYMTAADYLRTVLEGVRQFHSKNPSGIVCRVIVSISRHLTIDWAWKTLTLTEDLITGTNADPHEDAHLIVGLELSGNPHQGTWHDFEPIFDAARKRLRLPISLHFAEIDNEAEALAMLRFHPHRVGHAVRMSETVAKKLLSQRPSIGVEVCITSNLVTESVNSTASHPVITHLLPTRHPFCLCTDDSGVFNTTLSDEYARLTSAANLSKEEAKKISRKALLLAFCTDEHVLNQVRHNLAE